MKCPDCLSDLELQETSVGESVVNMRGPQITSISANYYCPVDRSYWVWEKGVPGIKRVEPSMAGPYCPEDATAMADELPWPAAEADAVITRIINEELDQ